MFPDQILVISGPNIRGQRLTDIDIERVNLKWAVNVQFLK